MKRFTSAVDYFEHHADKEELLLQLRDLLLECGLTETIKWGGPCYTHNNKNVAGIASFKSYTGLWFYKGALMKDPASVLVNAQKGVTKALRQWRFEKNDPLDHDLLKSYIYEAIKIEDLQLDLPKQAIQKIQLPHVLQKSFIENKELEDSFLAFTPFKQKEFCEYIQSAKRESTKLKRLQKVIELMRKGEGLNDRYRK